MRSPSSQWRALLVHPSTYGAEAAYKATVNDIAVSAPKLLSFRMRAGDIPYILIILLLYHINFAR